MKRLLLSTLLVALVLPGHVAAEDDQSIAYFYPLRTRRPVIERELELQVEHEKARAGRATNIAAAIELPILPRWQVEIEIPLVFLDPRDGASVAGFGDVTVESKVL